MINKYTSLLRYQVRTDLHTRYLGSILGIYWSVINPLLQVVIYVFIFSYVFKVSLGGTSTPFEYGLFCLSGLGAWFSFQESLISCATSISRNAAIVRNVVFPLEFFPISSVLCSFIAMGTTYFALIILLVIDGHHPNSSIFALPIILVIQAIFSLGLGFYLSIVGAFFRDITQILPLILQFIMLATPIVYQKSDVPKALEFLIVYNPFYYVFDSYRQVFYYGTWPNWHGLLYVFCLGVFLLITGWKTFRIARGYFEAVV